MIYKFNEINAPIIESEFGDAKIVECDLDRLVHDRSSIGVYVVYSVIDHGWASCNFRVGVWGFDHIKRIIESVSLVKTP